jgi:hypothetical protein
MNMSAIHSYANNNATPSPLPVTLLSWRPMVKNSLLGFACVRLGKSLVIRDVAVMSSHGKYWASLPSKPMIDRDGVAMRDAAGRQRYSAFLEWTDRDASDRFSAAVIAAVRLHAPDDLAAAS